jgi:hypothetical protein
MRDRGAVLAPLLIASAEARRYRNAANPEMAAYARRQADALISTWVIEDRAAGRRSAYVVAGKMEAGWSAVDLLP